MKRSILALASGAFILGAAEFVMMGILPQTATAMHVSIPAAGHYISAYAIGVCVGTLILVFGRKVPPKHLIILFMAIALVGNTLSAVSFCSPMLLVARFISGLPHGAFFGTATLIAKTLADKGKEAQSVSMMVMWARRWPTCWACPRERCSPRRCPGGWRLRFWPPGRL